MVKVINRLRHTKADAGCTLQILQRGRPHLSRSSKMQQQRTLARRTDAGNIIQRAGSDGAAAFGAVRADHIAMHLIAQSLEIEKNR